LLGFCFCLGQCPSAGYPNTLTKFCRQNERSLGKFLITARMMVIFPKAGVIAALEKGIFEHTESYGAQTHCSGDSSQPRPSNAAQRTIGEGLACWYQGNADHTPY